ncbi:small ribosomal subunit protein uS17-like [Halichondria panicea]|uniref:small ribosomal subunit protein uS17-like n=1 Tax=Halichondria panicea TaxID=6063 RepID=UPI00312B5B90
MSQFLGRVVGTKMQKTAKVEVVRMFLHPQVLKYVRKRKKFFAHDEKEECGDGDLVVIKECQPLSKKKYFKVSEIVRRVEHHKDPRTGEVIYQGRS